MALNLSAAQILSESSRKTIPLAVNVMFLLVLVIVGRIQEFVPGLTGLPLAKLLFVAMAILVLTSSQFKQVRPFSHPQIKACLLLFALGCLSIMTSRWPGESYRFMTNDVVAIVIFVFFLIKVCGSWQALWRICWSLLVTATLLSFTILLNHEQGRASIAGTTYDPNDLAFIIVLLMPFFYFIAKTITRKRVKLLLILGLIAQIVTVMLTQSRGGFIGLMVVVAAILMYEKVRPLTVVLVGCVLCLVFTLYAPEGYWDRMSTIGKSGQDYNVEAESGRLAIWKRGIGFMFANPVLGIGPNVFPIADGESRGGRGKWSAAHNSFVQIGAELGFVGLSLFLWMIASSLKAVRAARSLLPPGSPETGLLSSIEVGFYGYVAAGFFLSQAYSFVLFLLVGMSVVATNLTRSVGPLGVSKTRGNEKACCE